MSRKLLLFVASASFSILGLLVVHFLMPGLFTSSRLYFWMAMMVVEAAIIAALPSGWMQEWFGEFLPSEDEDGDKK